MCTTVVRIIVENFNYCNRTCETCSNAVIDRRSTRIFMQDRTFARLLDELAAGSYNHDFAFGRYHEPLADPILIDRVRMVRQRLPDVHIYLNTNGDYLTRALAEQLFDAGLDDMKVMRYFPNGHDYDTRTAQTLCESMIEQLGYDGTLTTIEPDCVVYYRVDTGRAGTMSLRSESYARRGCDRGGLVPALSGTPRVAPCFAPFFEINIDYDGSVLPCCNMRADAHVHRRYVLGNINYESLTDIYFGTPARYVRLQVAGGSPSLPPCRLCRSFWPPMDKSS